MKTKYIILPLAALMMGVTSCVKDLNTAPIDPNSSTSEDAYKNEENYLQGLAKCYGMMAMSGQTGGESGEIDGVDAGLSTFIRGMWNCNEMSTDHAICAWGDDYVETINTLTWNSALNKNISAVYYRQMFAVTTINEYLKQTDDAKLALRGVSDDLKAKIQGYRHEARFIRALMYSYLIDLFGNPPFVTENDPIGKVFPKQIGRAEVFKYVESELIALSEVLPEPRTNLYARVDRAAAWALLSRLYLNAEVYTGEDRYGDCITWSNKVINAGYSLADNYANLFKADNDINAGVSREIIMPIAFDGTRTEAFGTTFLVMAARTGDIKKEECGTTENWGGVRARKNLVDLFPNSDQIDANGFLVSPDQRCIIYMKDRTKEIANSREFKQGYGVYKWRQLNSDGSIPTGRYANTDFPLFRLAEIYLNYAEATLRGGAGGDAGKALDLINQLRARAYGNTSGNISSAQMSLDFILEERGRELYWEGFRRPDLVRYNKFTSGDYLWPYKGGANVGRGVDARYNLFPIPDADMKANYNLVQNAGY